MDFETWKAKCNKIVLTNVHVSIDELPDAPWRDYYDYGMDPQVAIECALEDSWYDEPLLEALFRC